jgi:outer membrane protein assembly factor BamA
MRFYQRIGASGLLALRARGFKSWGGAPDFLYFGGNSEMRGYQYLEFVGSRSAFLNAELRFPLIEAMLTPLGVLGGIRGVFFANMGGGHFEGQPFKWLSRKTETITPVVGYRALDLVRTEPIYGTPKTVSGLRLVDAKAAYGVGLETFALGFPVHIDWSWKTLLNKDWEDTLFAAPCQYDGQRYCGGSATFRKPKVSFWIGYDF